jgi:hypothetical protein
MSTKVGNLRTRVQRKTQGAFEKLAAQRSVTPVVVKFGIAA